MGYTPQATVVIEAKRFGATQAITLVHSFSRFLEHFDDYSNLAGLYNVEVMQNKIIFAAKLGGIDFYIGWVVGNAEYLKR